jgi:hypothetical protein
MCPSCRQTSLWNRGPVRECGKCGAAFPDDVRNLAEAALAQSQAPTPFLLSLGQLGAAVFALGFGGMLLLAPFDAGTFTVNGEQVSGPEFLRRAGLLFGGIAVLMAAIAVGLWQNRPWARPLMVGYWLLAAAMPLVLPAETRSEMWASSIFMIVAAAIAAWYLYGKENVRAYFEAWTARTPAPREPGA